MITERAALIKTHDYRPRRTLEHPATVIPSRGDTPDAFLARSLSLLPVPRITDRRFFTLLLFAVGFQAFNMFFFLFLQYEKYIRAAVSQVKSESNLKNVIGLNSRMTYLLLTSVGGKRE